MLAGFRGKWKYYQRRYFLSTGGQEAAYQKKCAYEIATDGEITHHREAM